MVADALPTFSVQTTEPNVVVAPVHDRMPVVVGSAELDSWLAGEALAAQVMIRPAPPRALVATKVSKHQKTVKNDDPECIAEQARMNRGPCSEARAL